MELNLAPPDKQSLSHDAHTWADKAKAFVITDAESCLNASYLLRSIKGMRSDIQRWFAPHIDAAMETKRKADAARKALVDECDRMEAPLVAAEGSVKKLLLDWERQQEALRLAEERRLQALALADAETRMLNAAADLERAATDSGDADMLAEAQDILAQPIEAAAVSVKTFVPKVQGVTYRDNWKAHPEIDIRTLAAAVASGAVPATFLTPNLTALNAFARATKGTQDVPGVRIFNDRLVAAHG